MAFFKVVVDVNLSTACAMTRIPGGNANQTNNKDGADQNHKYCVFLFPSGLSCSHNLIYQIFF